jgi:hypothetical protein
MLRAHSWLFILGTLLGAATAANAQDCEIVFGRGGASVTFSSDGDRDINDVEGPWEFIRSTRGPCTFQVFNDPNLSGKSVLYGTEINKRIRIGATGAQDSEGWRARSLRIIHDNTSPPCPIVLGDSDVSQTFSGPIEKLTGISGWDFVRKTSCNGART